MAGAFQSDTFQNDAFDTGGGAAVLTLDAVLRRTQSSSFTLDATLRRTRSASFTLDAFVRFSFTLDAVIAAVPSAGAFQADAFQNDAFQVSGGAAPISFTLDAVLRRTQSASLTLDAVLWRSQSASFTLDAITRRTQTASLTADAVLKRSQPTSFTADAAIFVPGAKTFTLDAVLRGSQAASLTIDAITRVGRSSSLTADAVLRRTESASLTVDAVLKREKSASLTLDAAIAVSRSASFTLDAAITGFPVVADADTQSGAVGTASTTWALPWPTNLHNGDLVIAFISTAGDTYPQAFPSGWLTWPNSLGDGSSSHAFGKYKANGTESGTFNVTLHTSQKGVYRIFRIYNWEGTLGTDIGNGGTSGSVVSTTHASFGDANPDPAALTPANWGAENTLWLASASASNGPTFSGFPTNYTNTSSDALSGSPTLGIARRNLNAATEDPGTFTISASEPWETFTIAVRPGTSGAPGVGTASLTLDGVLRKTQSKSFTLDAAIGSVSTVTTSFTADAITRKAQSKSLTLNAVTKSHASRSLTLDAYLDFAVIKHDRATSHTGVDHEVDHILAQAFDRYAKNEDLTDVLADLDARITALEVSGRRTVLRSRRLTLDAVVV